ncbi:tripartite tricarboxylate transporter TctB family protein [uncultured Tateyamaria sp.]|uniref:tripartite tricarboxylate transporter TctB family protein n=1 Tax=uncultured Tateyamaria sp. TaxID=455651 RepID=UPI0026117E0B|nr:tripartite tricarboxylate transporter TctB family protein [uncultured Tateyamaria sp.]
MKSRSASPAPRSATAVRPIRSDTTGRAFASACPPDSKINVTDITDFRRGRGDLIFSLFMAGLALFFLAFFFTQTGWEGRKLPQNMARYWMDQFGVTAPEGRTARLGRILKQSWVAPLICLGVLVPAALWNLRGAWRAQAWRQRFKQPTGIAHELGQWLRALEYVVWFVAYTLLVPVLGYLVSTVLLGTLLPWRLGYRGWRWMGICLAASFAIVLVFRTGLQIKTPVNIWLYDQLPQRMETFMQVWF